MKFVVSSTELLRHLNAISKVISNKNTLPILDNFLFHLSDNKITITASDLETTLISSVIPERMEGEGYIAIPSKILTDTLKEFAEQPLTFQVDLESCAIEILSETGKFSIVGQDGQDYPELPKLQEEQRSIQFGHDVLLHGIEKTIYATADDELRPVMNGIFVEFSNNNVNFVATDAHKLVRYQRKDLVCDFDASFVLPKKPAQLLKGILPKEEFDVTLKFDDYNAVFEMTDYYMVCRLVEGKYPPYNSVIPKNNPNIVTVDRLDFYNTLKRVSVFANQASNLVKLDIRKEEMVVSAQDVDYAISGVERVACNNEGAEIEIGFKSTFLLEILNNINAPEIRLELCDPSRAGLILPSENEFEHENILTLLMPMMVGV